MLFPLKNKLLVWLGVGVLGSCLLVACQSAPDSTQFDTAPLIGVIFDGASRGVQGFTVTIDGKITTNTDINGKFNFPATKRGKHTIQAIKADHQPVSIEFTFERRSQILYITSNSLRDYIAQAEIDMQKRDFVHAEEQVAQALRLQPKDVVALYLLATIKLSTVEFEAAYGILKDLLAANVHEQAVYLLMIDLAAIAPAYHDEVWQSLAKDPYIAQLPVVAKAMDRINPSLTKDVP